MYRATITTTTRNFDGTTVDYTYTIDVAKKGYERAINAHIDAVIKDRDNAIAAGVYADKDICLDKIEYIW